MTGMNLFVYCGNNPISRMDPDGNAWIYNGVVYNYDGSVADFHRMEHGQSPQAYANAVLAATGNKNKLPLNGKPNSTAKAPNGNEREYGPDGRAKQDHDYSHPERHPELKNPHDHDWTWDDGLPSRGKPHNIDLGSLALGLGVVVICAVGIVIITADDVTGVGVTDDYLLVPLGGAMGKGFVLLFGG